MESWTLVIAVLVAVLVGAALPVLFETYRTLRQSRRTLRRIEDDLGVTLAEIRETARHANRFGDALDPHLGEVAELMESLAGLARPIRELRSNLIVLATATATVAPAVAAAVRAFAREHDGETDAPSDARTAGAGADARERRGPEGA